MNLNAQWSVPVTFVIMLDQETMLLVPHVLRESPLPMQDEHLRINRIEAWMDFCRRNPRTQPGGITDPDSLKDAKPGTYPNLIGMLQGWVEPVHEISETHKREELFRVER